MKCASEMGLRLIPQTTVNASVHLRIDTIGIYLMAFEHNSLVAGMSFQYGKSHLYKPGFGIWNWRGLPSFELGTQT